MEEGTEMLLFGLGRVILRASVLGSLEEHLPHVIGPRVAGIGAGCYTPTCDMSRTGPVGAKLA